jgi:hypothetical protein
MNDNDNDITNKCSLMIQRSKKKRVVGCLTEDDLRFLEYRDSRSFFEDMSRFSCDSDLCVLDKIETKYPQKVQSIKTRNYKPQRPRMWTECDIRKAPYQNCEYFWLSNYDINNVISQYDDMYTNFLFLGVFMIDFLEVGEDSFENAFDLSSVDISAYQQQGINCFACVFNTGKTGTYGEHWVSLFVFWNGKRGEINYFNSDSIQQIPDSILLFMKHVIYSGKKAGIRFVCQKSKIRHQTHESECGTFSIYFIIHSLQNALTDIKERINDDEIHQYRNVYWRP